MIVNENVEIIAKLLWLSGKLDYTTRGVLASSVEITEEQQARLMEILVNTGKEIDKFCTNMIKVLDNVQH